MYEDEDDYEPIITYIYAVDGVSYTGDRVSSWDNLRSSSRGNAEEVVQEYQPGSVVQVFYDSSNPAEAILETGPAWPILWASIIGFFVLILGTFAGVYGIKAVISPHRRSGGN